MSNNNIIKAIGTLLLALALLGGLPATAQKLETRDFRVSNEPTARLGDYEMTDENGRRAALIKIYTPFVNEMLGFDLGLFKVVGRRQAGPGEVWLYVPARTQKVTVTHPKYDPVTFWLEGTEAESGKTYHISLNVEGREVSLIASTPNAKISVDGEVQGKSPVNMHMPLGAHLVRAELGSLLYEDMVTLTRDGETSFHLQMEDENLKFGDVDIEVDNAAELWFQDRREGVGRLHRHLRAGSYVITAKLPDHEDRNTTFTVEAGKTKTVKADAPVPHIGYLTIETEPVSGVVVTGADTVVTLTPTMQMPVDRYEYSFSKRGYYPQVRKYRIERGQTITDTVRLEKIQYVKKTTGYAAVSFKAGGTMGVNFTVGGFYGNINLEAGYSLGLGRSNEVEWYDRSDKILLGRYGYRMDEISVKAGCQLRFAERFGLTPQAGYLLQRLSAKDRGYPGNGFTQSSVSLTARFAYHPVPHVGIFVAPEYALPVGEKGDIRDVFSQGGMTRGGFRANIGVSVSL